MVPAVEDGRGDDPAQRAEIPVHIRVDEDGVEGEDRRGAEGDGGVVAEEKCRGRCRPSVLQNDFHLLLDLDLDLLQRREALGFEGEFLPALV